MAERIHLLKYQNNKVVMSCQFKSILEMISHLIEEKLIGLRCTNCKDKRIEIKGD